MNDNELTDTIVEIADEWADQAHAMIAEAVGAQPLDMDKLSAGTALLKKATVLLDTARREEA